MKKFVLTLTVLAALALAAAGCSDGDVTSPTGSHDASLDKASRSRGHAVIANRGSGTISVIDGKTFEVTGTYDLPRDEGEPTPEPMYVVYVHAMNRVFVGDRANDRVAVFDADSFDVVGTAPAGAGVFHMWADPQNRQLWVNNDVDNTSTVIDPVTLDVIATVPTPADLVAMGGKPHDVIVGPKGRYAYVTVLGFDGPNDYVVQFDTATFAEVARAAVGKDPHVSLARQIPWLYVPCQNTNNVYVFNRFTLAQEAILDVPGAHGAGMARNGRIFYTTNLTGGGTDALWAIDTRTNTVIGEPADAPYAVPHNIAIEGNGKTLFITHSGGTSDKVTVYQSLGNTVMPSLVAEVTVGLNPFGLAWVD